MMRVASGAGIRPARNPGNAPTYSRSMHIRPATTDDLDDLVHLLSILFSQEVELQPDAQKQRSGLAMIIATPSAGFILVVERDEQLVGMCSVLFSISTALGGRVGFLEDVVVLPSLRGQGVGSQLVNDAIRHAREASCLRLTLLTDGVNTSAQRFYRRHGFTASNMLPMRLLLT